MKTEKALIGWGIIASLFVAAETLLARKKGSYRIRRILDRGKGLLGIKELLVARVHNPKNPFPGLF